jgi:hypothetical protein
MFSQADDKIIVSRNNKLQKATLQLTKNNSLQELPKLVINSPNIPQAN